MWWRMLITNYNVLNQVTNNAYNNVLSNVSCNVVENAYNKLQRSIRHSRKMLITKNMI
jgi:hypothetical protein